jgi:hypothetical protein
MHYQILTITMETNIILKYVNISNFDIDSQWAFKFIHLQKSMGDVIRYLDDVIKIEIEHSTSKINEIFQSRNIILVVFCLSIIVFACIIYFFRRRQNDRFRKSRFVVLRAFRILPKSIVFNGRNVHYLLQSVLDRL